MVFDYASTNVRTNAVRAIHQLVECVANANPEKTLAMFLPFCTRNIRLELENGASSLRTTSSSLPIPSDATLHWSMFHWVMEMSGLCSHVFFFRSCNTPRNCLQVSGWNELVRRFHVTTIFQWWQSSELTYVILLQFSWKDIKVIKYRNELMSLIKLLHAKTYSKRGFSWSGKACILLSHGTKADTPDQGNSLPACCWPSHIRILMRTSLWILKNGKAKARETRPCQPAR